MSHRRDWAQFKGRHWTWVIRDAAGGDSPHNFIRKNAVTVHKAWHHFEADCLQNPFIQGK